MDLSLNISTSSSNTKTTPKAKLFSVEKKKKSNSGGFDFNFVKNDKIKAIVARKRPAKSTIAKQPETNKSLATSFSPKFGEQTANNPNQMQIKRATPQKVDPKKQDADIDSLLNIAKVKKPEDEASLSLNINTSFDLSKIPAGKLPFGDKKKKLSKLERKERVMQRRIETAHNKQEKKTTNANIQKPQVVTQKPQLQNQSQKPQTFSKDKVVKKKAENLFKDSPEIPVVGQRFVKPLNEIVFTGLPMSSIGLHPHLVKTLADLLGITELTNVQQRAVPVALEGRDILVRSQTGSGKTLAYALPIVQQLQEIQPKINRLDGIFALVIVPTRELAIQTLEVFIKLLKPFTWIVPTYITGGEKRKSEKARLRKGVNILIGTPGRICDHLLHTESFKLDKVKYLVLDEADRLYECGYEKDVKVIVEALNKGPELKNPFVKPTVDKPQEKRTSNLRSMLLSATLTPAVHQLAGLALKNPIFIDTSDQKNVELPTLIPVAGTSDSVDTVDEHFTSENIVIPEKVTQKYVLVPPKLRLVSLTGLIAKETCSEKKSSKILIFFATEHLVDYHYDLMTETLTRKQLDSDDEDDDDDDSESDLEDEDGLLDTIKSKTKKRIRERPLLANVKFFKLHGSLTQQERSAIFKAFKEAKSGVLLTTDVTARGIDVPMVDLVVQFSAPHKIADYVHRVGRTARAGRSGSAILFLCPNEVEFIRTLESKRIRIAQDDYKTYLKGIQENSDSVTGTLEEMASELQRKFEVLVTDDNEIYEKACKVPDENYDLPYNQTETNGDAVMIKMDVPSREEPSFPKEKWKTFLAWVILTANMTLATVSFSLVHERLPDRKVYKPLPDVFLDNIKEEKWALDVSEILIMIQVNCCIVLITFHKHRFIVMRRVFLIMSILYFLRAITMYVTVLPMSSESYYCSPKSVNGTTVAVVANRVFKLMSGFGLSINGKHTYCGDFIYSGHTVMLVLGYLVISEYLPRRISALQWLSFAMALVGVLFVLLAHGHYTIDVLIAYYITTRLFWTYHTLANNAFLIKHAGVNNYLAREWWYKWSRYFEQNVRGQVPNEFEWPLSWPRRFQPKFPNRES